MNRKFSAYQPRIVSSRRNSLPVELDARPCALELFTLNIQPQPYCDMEDAMQTEDCDCDTMPVPLQSHTTDPDYDMLNLPTGILEEDCHDDEHMEEFQREFIPKIVESMTAREMYSLPSEEREKVYHDLHGVSTEVTEVVETPTFVQNHLCMLLKEMEKIAGNKAYLKAMELGPEYVQDTNFLLKFLRADKFDVKAAARRLANHFESKLDLFGPDLLVRDIQQDDLDQDDLQSLYHGDMVYDLPIRDRAGRLIFFQYSHSETDIVPIRARLRRAFYACMVAIEDEETQKSGIVGLSYAVGLHLTWQQVANRKEFNSNRARLLAALPWRLEAIHLCYDSVMLKPLFALFMLYSSMFNRVRTREHFGGPSDVLLSLQTFGIPTNLGNFPVAPDGTFLTHLCIERWEKRLKLERMIRAQRTIPYPMTTVSTTATRVGTPGRYDVLLGRGKACYLHDGNVRMRNLVSERAHLYEAASFVDKFRVVEELVELVKQGPARFLKDDGAGWVVVDDVAAQKKVSHAFRTVRGMRKAECGAGGHGTFSKRQKKKHDESL